MLDFDKTSKAIEQMLAAVEVLIRDPKIKVEHPGAEFPVHHVDPKAYQQLRDAYAAMSGSWPTSGLSPNVRRALEVLTDKIAENFDGLSNTNVLRADTLAAEGNSNAAGYKLGRASAFMKARDVARKAFLEFSLTKKGE